MTRDLLVTFGTVIAFGSIMFFTVVFVVHGVASANDGFTAFVTFFSSQLVISFANWLIFINEKLPHEYVIADETTHAFGMIEFLAGFDAIAFDRLLTFATSFRDFGITFVTIRFITPLKKFPIDFLSAGTALKALFVVDFAEGCAAFHAH